MFEILIANHSVFVLSVLILGLLVGSFLNVVIYRLPIMLMKEWTHLATDILKEQNIKVPELPEEEVDKRFNLVIPRSTCPACDHQITALENIPILSYLFLKGKCSNCKTRIPFRYPMVEALTGISFICIACYFGFSWATALGLIFTATLIALTFIDIDKQLLPDVLTIPLMWLGIIAGIFNVFVPLTEAVIGALAGYLSLWSVYWIFKLLTGKEGMGHGDFKLLTALGAFLGWKLLPLVILLSAAIGTCFALIFIVLKKNQFNSKIPFGPYLAIAGWVALIWGNDLVQYYLQIAAIYP